MATGDEMFVVDAAVIVGKGLAVKVGEKLLSKFGEKEAAAAGEKEAVRLLLTKGPRLRGGGSEGK